MIEGDGTRSRGVSFVGRSCLVPSTVLSLDWVIHRLLQTCPTAVHTRTSAIPSIHSAAPHPPTSPFPPRPLAPDPHNQLSITVVVLLYTVSTRAPLLPSNRKIMSSFPLTPIPSLPVTPRPILFLHLSSTSFVVHPVLM